MHVSKTEPPGAFLPRISVKRSGLRSRRPRAKEQSLWDEAVPAVREDKMRAHVIRLNMFKFWRR